MNNKLANKSVLKDTFNSDTPAVSRVRKHALQSISATKAAGISNITSGVPAGSARITELAINTAREAGVTKISSYVVNALGKLLCPSVR